jgi:UDP-N-acetylglucosamine/UDP-N-acetylgalactosamine 4-epimerase
MQEKKSVLVTGGAGFIGSNLVETLLYNPDISFVRVLDNLSTGFYRNIQDFLKHPKFEFIEGDIRDVDTCMKACDGIDMISHQAALGSVPRSIKDPVTSTHINILGTVNIFDAARRNNIKRVVYAASSSTYGDSKKLPKVENEIGNPLSPYAITKLVMEYYAKVFADLYGTEFIGLRYFNVFGPKQDPNGAYAAVIPLFFKAALSGQSPTINGDGTYSRDFTFVENAVQANNRALFTQNKEAINQVYNIACGERTDLNQLWEMVCKIVGKQVESFHGPERSGDIPHSLADISKARNLLDYEPEYKVFEGLKKSHQWYTTNL